jgi:hypothetical protein
LWVRCTHNTPPPLLFGKIPNKPSLHLLKEGGNPGGMTIQGFLEVGGWGVAGQPHPKIAFLHILAGRNSDFKQVLNDHFTAVSIQCHVHLHEASAFVAGG